MRRACVAVLGALLAAVLPVLAATPTSPPAAADSASPYALVSVSGASLGNVTAGTPYALSPVFSPSTTDYVLRCNAGPNEVHLTLTGSGGPLSVGTNQQGSPLSGGSVEVTVGVVPNEAIVLYAPNPSNPGGAPAQYWIRCLPPDFPEIQVNTAGPATSGWTPGYYFTGNISSGQNAYYAMVLDGNGVPVWYQHVPSSSLGPVNVEPLPNNTIAWAPSGLGPGIGAGLNGNAYTGFNLDSQSTIAPLPSAVSPTDPHELLPLPNGDRMMISTPVIPHDLSTLGSGVFVNTTIPTPASSANNTIADCVIQEVNPQNQAVWTWDAAQHVGNDEVNTVGNPGPPWILDNLNGTLAADIYHCNSVAVDQDASSPYFGDVLVSMRNLNAVFLIDRTTGDVIWKMGGRSLTANDPESQQTIAGQSLVITGDNESQFCGQHDARFVPTPDPAVEDISVYDDHTQCTGAARGVEYALDTDTGTATLDYQYAQPQGLQVPATGSFRRMPDAANDVGSGSSVIGWGISTGAFLSGLTEVDGSGRVLCDIRFPNGEVIYRAIKVGASAVNLTLLRQTAGWTGSTIPAPPSGPRVTAVNPASGPVGGGTAVTISGSDFTGTSSVTFGGHPAAFSVTSAGTIVAASPPGVGLGTVDVVVTAPGGTSPTSAADSFTYSGVAPPIVVGLTSTPDGGGYWEVASDGQVLAFGDAVFYGSASNLVLEAPIVGMTSTPDGNGYWLVASDGGIFSYGDAGFYGSRGGQPLNKPLVGMAASPTGNGYWLIASDGGIFSYGDAGFYGSRGGQPLNKPVVGVAASPSGKGYWLVASDGGIFSYGDAGFYGSTGGLTLNKPVVGMAATPAGGYWLVASDGGIFSYGDAVFYGSTGDLTLNKPVVGMATANDEGYWLGAADGGIFSYGSAGFEGSAVGG